MRKKLSLFFILLFAAMLITGGSSPVLASRQVVVDDELDPIVRNIHNILPDTDEAENYCADVRDIRMTTLDRDACSQKQLQAILIRKADVVFKISANHKVTKKLKIVSVAGASLQKVKKAADQIGRASCRERV